MASPFTGKLQRDRFSWTGGAKLSLIVQKDVMGLLHVHDHVQLPVAVNVPETECDGCEVLPVSNQGRHKVYLGFCCVSPWKLDDLYMPVDIDSDKMTWMGRTISMTHNHIRLIGSGSAIVQVVLIAAPPVHQK